MIDQQTSPLEITVSTRIARELLRHAVSLGASEDALRAAAGITRKEMAHLEGRIPSEKQRLLWAAVLEATDDPDFGLHMGARRAPGDPSLLGYLVATAPTLGTAYETWTTFFTLFSNGAEFCIDRGGADRPASLTIRPAGVGYFAAAPRHPTEAYFAVLVAVAGMVTGRRLTSLQVAFAHDRPATGTAAHEEVFGVVPTFGAPVSRLSFDAAALDWPGLQTSPRLHATLRDEAELVLGGLHPSLPQRVARAVADRFRGDVPTLGEVAASLSMGERTLQRHLEEAGTTFLDVVDAVRRELAILHLDTGWMKSHEVAYLLGYSGPSAFTRAFKRWMGMTPGAYRAQHARE